MILYSSSNHCPPCIKVKMFMGKFGLHDKVETKLVSTFEEMPAGAKSTPCLQLDSGELIHNSEAITNYLTQKYLQDG